MARKFHNRSVKLLATLFEKRPLELPFSHPIISFTFDDCPASACRAGADILSRHSLHGTFYLSMGLINTAADSGPQFTGGDMENLYADGHEIGCHTYGHSDACKVSAADYERSMRENRDRIRSLLPGVNVESFSYPFGSAPLSAKRSAGKLYSTCRGIFPGINFGIADLNLLCAYRLYSRCESLSRISKIIGINSRCKGWLIFYTHDVQENPSPFGCTPDYLKTVVEYACQSEAIVLPVSKALEVLFSVGSGRITAG